MTDHWTGKRRREILFLDCVTLDDFESYIHPLSALDFFFFQSIELIILAHC